MSPLRPLLPEEVNLISKKRTDPVGTGYAEMFLILIAENIGGFRLAPYQEIRSLPILKLTDRYIQAAEGNDWNTARECVARGQKLVYKSVALANQLNFK